MVRIKREKIIELFTDLQYFILNIYPGISKEPVFFSYIPGYKRYEEAN
jgi:hypothetical protein